METSPRATPAVTFIIPVRHPDNAKDWGALTKRLLQTALSIAAQTNKAWSCIVVANEGAELPPLPAGFSVVRVGFAPNPLHDLGAADREAVYEAFRIDKGRRVLAGMLEAGSPGYFMIVDDDDFVSRDIVDFVAKNSGANGWSVTRGYVWSEGGRLVFLHSNFASLCGTSHIVRADLYRLPSSFEAADEDDIKNMLGSHIQIEETLRLRGTALAPLPFPGAVYRVGHAEAHSKSAGMLRTYLLNRATLSSPRKALRRLRAFRVLGAGLAAQFGM